MWACDSMCVCAAMSVHTYEHMSDKEVERGLGGKKRKGEKWVKA